MNVTKKQREIEAHLWNIRTQLMITQYPKSVALVRKTVPGIYSVGTAARFLWERKVAPLARSAVAAAYNNGYCLSELSVDQKGNVVHAENGRVKFHHPGQENTVIRYLLIKKFMAEGRYHDAARLVEGQVVKV